MTNRPAPPPPRRAAPPAPPASNGHATAPATEARTFSVSRGRVAAAAQRVVIYGPGGIGKSSLAALAPSPLFIDVEHGTRALDVPRIDDIETYADLLSCLRSDVVDQFGTVIIDSATRVEEMAVAHTLLTVPNEKGHAVARLEDYGYGKGYQHVYEVYLLLLQECDRLIRKGINTVLIAHDCTSDVPNPAGENYLRYEPHLQSTKGGKSSIRNKIVQWADHVFFIGYDVIAEKNKGIGGGTRTIWPVERPDHIAKSRTLSEPMEFAHAADDSLWRALFTNEEN